MTQLTIETMSRAAKIANAEGIQLWYDTDTISDQLVDWDYKIQATYSRIVAYKWQARVYGLELNQDISAGHDHADEILNAWLDYVEACAKLMGTVA